LKISLCNSRLCSAFTLIELLIVVAIIAILAAIAVPNFLEAQTRAKVSRAKADMRSMATAAETYRIDNNDYMSSTKTSNTNGFHWGITNHDDYRNILATLKVRYDALFKLTSPISYMTTLPAKNPFGRYQGYYVGRYYEGYMYRGPSVYKIIKQSNNTQYPREWYDNVFSFDSTGPSKKVFDQNKYLIYDPTNGTMSYGGIWYVRGSTSYTSFQ